jgi:hypothetical protein
MSNEQIYTWREAINNYKAWYEGEYKHRPSEKLIESFCNLRKIPWPIPREDIEELEQFMPPAHIDMLFGGEIEG